MSDRQMALEAIQKMPEQISWDEILDEISLLASIRRGEDQIRRGEGIPHEKAAAQLHSWISESSGRPKR